MSDGEVIITLLECFVFICLGVAISLTTFLIVYIIIILYVKYKWNRDHPDIDIGKGL